MRIIANENVPGDAVDALRARCHDVVWVRTEMSGSADAVVLARAQSEGRVVVTFDKDFGELAFRSRLAATCGVVLFRIAMPSSTAVAAAVVGALESRDDWVGHFAVVEDDRVRIRALPAL